jgi:hypothetical protein
MKKLIPVILILICVVIGCKWLGSAKDGATGTNSTGASGGGRAKASSDPRADVVEASKKFLDLPYFTANMEGQGQTPIKSQVQYSAPDKFHVKYLGGTGAGMEMIWIGKDLYMNANGKWTKMPASNTSLPTLRDSFTEEGLKTLTDVTAEGEDSIDGKPALVYGYKNVTPPGKLSVHVEDLGEPGHRCADEDLRRILERHSQKHDGELRHRNEVHDRTADRKRGEVDQDYMNRD